MTKAYSYIRFSTDTQKYGQSLQRQLEFSSDYAQKHNLTLDTTLNMKDLGVSAYRGDNLTDGALGGFIKAVKDGGVEKGSYLLVESLDRLSRDKVHKALILLLQLLDLDIVIVTLSDGRKYDKENIDTTDLIISITIMSRAHEESQIKSLRIKKAWSNKRNNIKTKKLSKWCPKWLYLSEDKTMFLEHDDRVKIVKNIFEWSKQGLGAYKIIQKLDGANIDPWSSDSDKDAIRRKPKMWHISYIQRILTDRTVIGELKMKDGEVVEDYYPSIIPNDLFNQVQALRANRNVRSTGTGAGRKGKTLSNLFSGIAYCGYSTENRFRGTKCDGDDVKMIHVNKGSELKYLQCSRKKTGSIGCINCSSRLWPYKNFEKSFLTHITNIDISDLLGDVQELKIKSTNIKNEMDTKSGELIHIEKEIDKIKNALEEHDAIPDFIIKKGIELESNKETKKNEIKALSESLAENLKQTKSYHGKKDEINKIMSLLDDLTEDDLFDLRTRLSEIIKTAVSRIDVFVNGMVLDIKKVEKEMGKEAVSLMLDESLQKHKLGIIDVFFKSGHRSTLQVDLKSPDGGITLINFDENKDFKIISLN